MLKTFHPSSSTEATYVSVEPERKWLVCRDLTRWRVRICHMRHSVHSLGIHASFYVWRNQEVADVLGMIAQMTLTEGDVPSGGKLVYEFKH